MAQRTEAENEPSEDEPINMKLGAKNEPQVIVNGNGETWVSGDKNAITLYSFFEKWKDKEPEQVAREKISGIRDGQRYDQ